MSELPEGWAEAALGSLGRWASGATPSKSNSTYWAGKVPWVSPKDLKSDFISNAIDHVSRAGIDAANLKLLPPGTLLFVVRGLILARAFPVALTRVPVTINQDIRALTPFAYIDGRYLFRALQHLSRDILHSVKEATHGTLRLDAEDLKCWPIRIPPLAEQLRIVEKIEALVARVDTAREKLLAAQRLLEKTRASFLHAACEGTLSKEWAAIHIPEAERQWTVTRLGDTFDVATGATPLRRNRAYYDGGTVPWVKSGAVNESEISSTDELITPLALHDTNAKLFPPGTLLVAMYGEGATRGKVAELKIEAATNQALAAILFDDSNRALQPFLKLVLEARYHGVRGESEGGVQPNLSLEMIRAIQLPVPPAAERDEVVRRAAQFKTLLPRIDTCLRAAYSHVDHMFRSILTKAFTGELVPTEAELARREGRSYEPASVLLDRMRTSTDGKPLAPRRR